jgi:hypothetical protein
MDDASEPLRRWLPYHPHARIWVWLFIVLAGALMVLYAWLHPYFRQRAAIRTIEAAWGTSDEMVEHLQYITALETVILDSPDATDAAVGNLGQCRHLKSVIVSNARIAGTALAALNQLEHLYVCNTPNADSGLEEIAKLPRLTSLRLQNAGITPAGFEKFKQTRPDCTINDGTCDSLQ